MVHLPSAAPRPPATRRGALRRFLETRGVLGGHSTAHVTTRLETDDGIRLAGTYLQGAGGTGPAVLLLHGFAAHRRKPSYAYLADALAADQAILSLDLRGHGASRGASTLGDREALDVAAGVRWLRSYGHPWIAVVGMSMGGTAALHATGTGVETDAVVAISAPARLRPEPDTVPMRRLHSVWTTPWKRYGMRLAVGVRVVPPAAWQAPPHPEEAVRSVTAPLLVVHGEDDPYFPVGDAEAIVANAGSPAVLWREPPGFGHAEDGVTPAFVARLNEALAQVRQHGRFPARGEAG